MLPESLAFCDPDFIRALNLFIIHEQLRFGVLAPLAIWQWLCQGGENASDSQTGTIRMC
jgi:hypothetical protein